MAQPSLKLITDKNLRSILEYILKKLKSFSENVGGSGIESISGDFVDNTDTLNPILDRGYKVYTALLTQTGTDAPVATVLENTLGGEVVWSYAAVGIYQGALSEAFPISKTILFLQNTGGQDSNYYINDNNIDYVGIATAEAGVSTNNILFNTPIEIRVYN